MKEIVPAILAKWKKEGIRFWPTQDTNLKDWIRASIILIDALNKGTVRFFVPICPDYPLDSRTDQLGTGIFQPDRALIKISEIISTSLKRKVNFIFNFLLADTEIDLEEVVVRLAGSREEFLARCHKSVIAFKEELPSGIMVDTFSDFFENNWHPMQHHWEARIRDEIHSNEKFRRWLEILAWQRADKYKLQFGRQLTVEERLGMAIRHYAQYSVLGYWMRQYKDVMMINTDSPNLRAIRHPLFLNPGVCFPKVMNQYQRVPIIAPVP